MPQFGGGSEKCTVCNKTVYLAEKIVVEDKEDRKTFHKTCLKCTHCKCGLTLGNYASMQGVFYCKPHFKQLFATKGNYDEGFGKDKHSKNWTPQVATAPASFVPVDKDESSASKKDTPSSIASKFGRSTLNTEKCHVCDKTVYATEKTVIEEKEGKKVFHKTCLKCSHCNVIVTLGNYASMQGVVYCKPHFKQLFAAKGNYDEGFGKEKASSKWEPQVSAAPTTFVPVDKDDGTKEKRAAPEAIANRFKTAANAEKCGACGKTVYATERLVVEDKEDRQTFHKACLRCSHCQVVLTLGNYASMKGVYYCKPHFKQLFAAKGNYDEGFGKEKHTKKWAEKDENDSTSTASASAPATQAKEEDPQELEREIEREKEQQEEERRRQEEERREREEREEREREEFERQQREERDRAEQEEREREEREEREREEREAEERQRMEQELENNKAQAEAEAEPEPEVQAEAEAEAEPEPEVEVEAEPEPESESQSEPQAESESLAEAESESAPAEPQED